MMKLQCVVYNPIFCLCPYPDHFCSLDRSSSRNIWLCSCRSVYRVGKHDGFRLITCEQLGLDNEGWSCPVDYTINSFYRYVKGEGHGDLEKLGAY